MRVRKMKKEYLRLHAFLLTTLVVCVYSSYAYSAPLLLVTRPGVLVERTTTGKITSYTLTLVIPPLTGLSSERLACLSEANVVKKQASTGSVEVKDGCVYFTVQNPSLEPLKAEVVLEVEEIPSVQPQPPVALIAAVASVAAASYLTMTEGGREKLFTALSLPVSYYVSRYEDVSRSPKRVTILEYVKANPGVTTRRISRETSISFGEVQWHLSILERLGFVERVRIGKYSCYYYRGTPLEVWLSNFVTRELRTSINAEALRKAKPRFEFLAQRGLIPYNEVQLIVTRENGRKTSS
ncbi:hypothetical protein MA03_02280 [Infirmifilum uzonense]|uniref:HVO-0163 N-terminal HTH domain-containing protein n=2 Tax=Infirmifilum uzonense TaxID=1550241 RepID=A0A0F7FGQ1_9CREN|nr:hypothetical protein MA03_02280 [Infirmifilum uzonense]